MKRPETGHTATSFPKLERLPGTDKESFRVSSNTTMRRREPTAPHRADKAMTMVWDYSKQQKVWPNGNNKALVEATQTTGAGIQNYATMNRATGKPYALGTIVGGSPDMPGQVYEKPPRGKIIRG